MCVYKFSRQNLHYNWYVYNLQKLNPEGNGQCTSLAVVRQKCTALRHLPFFEIRTAGPISVPERWTTGAAYLP